MKNIRADAWFEGFLSWLEGGKIQNPYTALHFKLAEEAKVLGQRANAWDAGWGAMTNAANDNCSTIAKEELRDRWHASRDSREEQKTANG